MKSSVLVLVSLAAALGGRVRLSALLACLPLSRVFCAQAQEAAPAPSMVEDLLVTPVKDVLTAGSDLVMDIVGLLMGAPRFAADVMVYLIGLLRELPAFAKNMYNADSATFDKCGQFAVSTASTVFVLYAALAALNLLLKMICTVKNAAKGTPRATDLWLFPFSHPRCTCHPSQQTSPFPLSPRVHPADYLKLPTKVLGQDVKNPVCDAIQQYVLDPIINWKNPTFLADLVGEPTVAAAAQTMASVMSGCMILACTPDALALISSGGVWRLLPTSHLHRKHARAPQRGFASRAMMSPPLTLVAANKSGAEALAWTLGTALGVKYLLNKA